MHRALSIPEIVRMILECFLARPPRDILADKVTYKAATALRSSVLSMALTCRSFSEPALDILWWAMDDLVPLFNLLPGFQNEQEISFPIPDPSREAFDRFANRIHFYCAMKAADDRVNVTAYVQVLQTLGRFHLLPHLQFLYTERNEPQLLFFGSPNLRTFRANGRSFTRSLTAAGHDHIQAFLDLLPHKSPRTLALIIRFSLREKSLHAVRRMSKLQFLVMDSENVDSQLSLDVDFLENLASRETLIEWCLHGNICVAPLPASGFPILNFDNLICLSFFSKKETSIAQYTPLLLAGNFPSLQRIHVSLTVDHTPGQFLSPTKLWRDFFKHLRSATVDSFWGIEVNIKGPTVCQVYFEDIPDLQLFSLDCFKTTLFHSLAATDLRMMSTHWPDLTTLHISEVDQVTLDLFSLVEIASLFPSLEDLEIQINCKTFPSVDDVPVLEHDLETFKLSPLHLENHISLARCIDRIFPNLTLLNIYGYEQFSRPGTGKEIQEIYEGLQSARRDQRKREKFSTPT